MNHHNKRNDYELHTDEESPNEVLAEVAFVIVAAVMGYVALVLAMAL